MDEATAKEKAQESNEKYFLQDCPIIRDKCHKDCMFFTPAMALPFMGNIYYYGMSRENAEELYTVHSARCGLLK